MFRVGMVVAGMVLVSSTMVGCSKRQTAFFPALLNDHGLVLTEARHRNKDMSGWGKGNTRDACEKCHIRDDYHQRDRWKYPLDLAEVQRFVRENGQASCRAYHGNNGSE